MVKKLIVLELIVSIRWCIVALWAGGHMENRTKALYAFIHTPAKSCMPDETMERKKNETQQEEIVMRVLAAKSETEKITCTCASRRGNLDQLPSCTLCQNCGNVLVADSTK